MKGKSKVRRKVWAIMPSILLVFTVIIFGSISLYGGNIDELWFPYSFIAPQVLLAALGLFIALASFSYLIPEKISKWIVALILGVGLAFYIEGTFVPLDYLKINGATIDWNKYTSQMGWDSLLWTFCMLASVSFLYFKEDLFKKVTPWVCGLIIAVQIVALVPVLINIQGTDKSYVLSDENKYTLSAKENIIVLVLDCYDNRLFEMFTGEDNQTKQAFSDFVYYKNAVSGFNYTTPSIPYILTGIPYDNSVPYKVYLDKSFSKTPLLKTLFDKGYDSRFYTFPKMLPLNNDKLANYISNAEKISDIKNDKRTSKSFLKFTALRYAPVGLKKYFPVAYDEFDHNISDMTNSKSINRDVEFYNNLITKGFSTQNEKNSFRFYHLNGAHSPFTLDSSLKPANLKTPQAFFQQAKGSMKLTVAFLYALKKAGIYDNSTIIIVGDHGILEDEQMSYYLAPVMLVKQKNQRQSSMLVQNAPVTNGDIGATIISIIDPQKKAAGNGRSVFSINENEKRIRHYYWYNGFQKTKDSYLPDLFEFQNLGKNTNIEDWVNTGRIFTYSGLKHIKYKNYKPGTPLDPNCLANQINTSNNSSYGLRGLYKEWGYVATSGSFVRLGFMIPKIKKDLPVYITASSAFPENTTVVQRVGIKVNGKKLPNEFNLSGSEKKNLKFVIPQEMLNNNGKLDLTLLIPNAQYNSSLQNDLFNLKKGINIYNLTIGKLLPLEKGDKITFNATGNSSNYIGRGWNGPESRHTWTTERAELKLPLSSNKDVKLKFRLVYPHDKNCVNVLVNGKSIGKWGGACTGKEWEYYKVLTIPKELMSKTGIQSITLEMPNAYKPKEINDQNDRVLGIPVMSIEVE